MTHNCKPKNIAKIQRMQKAIDAVNQAVQHQFIPQLKILMFSIPLSNNGHVSREKSHEQYQALILSLESELVRWIAELTITGYSPLHKTVHEMAE